MAEIGYPVPVLHPFPNVSQRVIQSERVRLFLTYWVGRAARIVSEPCDLQQWAIPAGRISRACRVLPFRLGRQALTVAVSLAIHRFAEPLRVVPTYVLIPDRGAREITGIGVHYR